MKDVDGRSARDTSILGLAYGIDSDGDLAKMDGNERFNWFAEIGGEGDLSIGFSKRGLQLGFGITMQTA